jgi:hypothetical protein
VPPSLNLPPRHAREEDRGQDHTRSTRGLAQRAELADTPQMRFVVIVSLARQGSDKERAGRTVFPRAATEPAAFASHVSSIPGYRRVDLEGVESGVGKLRRVHLAETWDQDHLSLPSQPPVLPPGNPSALPEKMVVLLQSAEARSERAVRSRQRLSQFDWPVVVERYLEIYHERIGP